MSYLSSSNQPQPHNEPPKIPRRFLSKKRGIIRIHNPTTQEFRQEYGYIYLLDPDDTQTLAVYGGHQAIVLDRTISDFENWTIVSLVEIWS